MSKRPVIIDTDAKSGILSSDNKVTAEIPDDLVLPKNATPEQVESARRDEQLIDQFRENLANNMRRFRAREKMTQTELGNRIGLSQSHIAFLERKKQNIGLGTLIKLARLFNVEPMVLLNSPVEADVHSKKGKSVLSSPENAWSGASLTGPPKANPLQIAVRPPLGEAFFGPEPTPADAPAKSAESSLPMETLLGSATEPLNLAVVSRMVGAAHKRIESLRQKHGSIAMTRAMLNGVLAAILNASHDADDECGDEKTSQPDVER